MKIMKLVILGYTMIVCYLWWLCDLLSLLWHQSILTSPLPPGIAQSLIFVFTKLYFSFPFSTGTLVKLVNKTGKTSSLDISLAISVPELNQHIEAALWYRWYRHGLCPRLSLVLREVVAIHWCFIKIGIFVYLFICYF
jgi:hypothetical protein